MMIFYQFSMAQAVCCPTNPFFRWQAVPFPMPDHPAPDTWIAEGKYDYMKTDLAKI